MLEQNKALVRRCFEEIWNNRNLAVVDEFYAPGYIGHIALETIRGPDNFRRFAAAFQLAFPDTRFTIEDQLAEGDKVASRWTASGTHRGELMGVAPSGGAITVTGISIQVISQGKIVESWDDWDTLGMLQSMTGDVFQALSFGI